MKTKELFRYFFFCLGMVILAFGLTLNTRTGLGATAIIAVSYAISEIQGWNLGDTTFWMYVVFVAAELVLHRMKYGSKEKMIFLKDVLQIPMSLFFTRFLNLFSVWIPDLGGCGAVRFLALALAIVCTGVGSALMIPMNLVPSPGDGIVKAAANVTGISTGLSKNITDITCVLFAEGFSLIRTGKLVGVGIGTIAAMLFVGRVIAVFDHFFKKKLLFLAEQPGK